MFSWPRFLIYLGIIGHLVQTAPAKAAVLIIVQRSTSPDLALCEQRLHSELIAEGHSPTTVQVDDTPNAAILVDTAKNLNSPAAIAIIIKEGLVSGLVWMVDPKKPGGLLRAVTAYPVSDNSAAVFAVSAADVLHGGLLELGYIQETEETTFNTNKEPTPATPPVAPNRDASPQKAEPPKSVELPAKVGKENKPHQRDRDWKLTLGFESIIPIASAPTALAPNISFTRRLKKSFSLGMCGHFTLPVTHYGKKGAADMNQVMAGPCFEYRYSFTPHWSLLSFFETGVHYAQARGRAALPLTNYSSYAYTVYHHLGMGVVWNATSDFGAWLRAGFLLPWRASDVIVVNEVVTKVATPGLVVGAGLKVQF
jgi:hypothetical protein